ncbi:MAG: alpha/beta hydrolase [Acidimicrobiia bacterium]
MASALFFTWFFAASMWTLNAIRKPVPPGGGFPPLWLPGMIVSELAPWLLVTRALIAWAFIAAGALDLGLGRAGLLLFVGSELGLIPLIGRTLRAAKDTGHSPRISTILSVRKRLPQELVKEVSIPYWDRYTLDTYRRADAHDAPALVYVHPGSWMRGRPGRQALPLFHRLASEGWVILDIRYPLSPEATFPDHLIGVKHAIAWARGPGTDLGIDPTRISISGGSSGAHLAALCALTWDRPELQPGFEEADTSVFACVPHYGIYDLLVRNGTRYDWPFVARHVLKQRPEQAPDLYRLGSPIDLVRPDAPPFMVVHGDFDSVVLVEESRHFVAALRSAGADVRYHEVGGAQHGFDAIASLRTRAVDAMIAEFLVEMAGR